MSKLALVNELHAPVRRNFQRRKYKQVGILDTYEIDLIDIQPYAKENKNNKYILIAIDIFSKFLYAMPMKSKNAEDTTSAMKKIFDKHKKWPKHIHSDNGREFYNSKFKALMAKHNIHLYSSFSGLKAAIAERVIRTIKTRLWKQFSYRGTYKYIDILDDIVDDYNKTIHRTIKMAPIKVNKKNEQMLLDTVYDYNILDKQKQKFKINDYVRISKYKGIFEKGYTNNWSFEIFQILKVQNTIPITYLLQDYNKEHIAGGFYQYELHSVANPDVYLIKKILKRKKNKVLVEWLGFKDNEWIDSKNII